MRRLVSSGLAALALLLPPVGARAEAIAARVGDASLPLVRVDAASDGKAERILERLHHVASHALDALIDERLLAKAPPFAPPTPEIGDADVDAFRAERAQDFEGPFAPGGGARDPRVQRAAIRHYLEREAVKEARAAHVASLRATYAVERRLPPAAELATPLAPQRVIAHVDGEPLHAAALETRAALRLYRLRGELARERLRQVEAWQAQQLLRAEAARRGTSVDALIEAETRTPGEAELAAFQAEEQAAGRPVPDAERALPYLTFRARHAARERLLEAARQHVPVQVFLTVPEPPRLPVETTGAPALGPADAARLVVYANYRCEVCRAVHQEVDRLRAASDDVRVVFRDWIPHYDPVAREAAGLARCAWQLGGEAAFTALRRGLLAADPPGFGDAWDREALARRARLEARALAACVEEDEVQRAIDADGRHARELGFESAPAFVAEGIPLSGAQSAAGLARAVREGLAPAGAQTTSDASAR